MTVLISCVIMYVTRGEGVQKSEVFADVIDGSPLQKKPECYFVVKKLI